MLSTSFWAVPAFMRVEPAMHFGSDQRGDGDIDGAGEFGIGRATDADGESAEAAGFAIAPST